MEQAERIIPNHLGLIVDGNRRWAKERGLTTYEGHKQGFEVLKRVAYYAQARRIPYLSAFIFSTENWQRSESEVSYLMKIFLHAFRHDMKQMIGDGFRIIFLGRRDRVSRDILRAMDEAEEQSAGNDRTVLALHFNYGGRAEIIDAARHLAADVRAGKANLAEMGEERFAGYMYHPELPDLDLMVRTSGEQRLSGFMLWRAAYSELMFIDKNWPDMTEQDIDDIIDEYSQRNRRFGK